MTVEEFRSLQIGDWVDAGVKCEITMIAQDTPRAYGVLVAGARGLTQLCEIDCASMKKEPPPAPVQRTAPTALDRTAEIIMQSMGFSDCRDHGIQPPMLEMFDTPDGPGLMPVCCCAGTAYPVYYGYVVGWNALPEGRRPKRPWRLVVSLGENPNLQIDENSTFRLGWRDQLKEVVEAGYCEVHGGDTNAIVSINHREDGMSEFDVVGCCAPFEEASRFAMVQAMKSSMTVD